MTFLLPWAMALGGAAAGALVLLHLVARHRPASYLLPTARFIPGEQSLVSRAASRPRDLLLLLVRVLLVLSAAAAFARPVVRVAHASVSRIVLLDRSALVADSVDARRRAQAAMHGGQGLVIPFGDREPDMIRSETARGTAVSAPASQGSISAALVKARRAVDSLARESDSVELVLVSPVATRELDAATGPVRALWPGAIRVERVAMRADSGAPQVLEHAVALADPLGPALATIAVRTAPRAIRLLRAPRLSAADSAYAVAGGTVVAWDSTQVPARAEGLALGDDVIVAPLGRRESAGAGRIVARWADGAAAATELPLGHGCVRVVDVAVPSAGDLPLRPGFQRVVRGLVAPCGDPAPVAADSATLARLAGSGGLAAASRFASTTVPPNRIVPWLLGIALLCALLELALRGRTAADEVVA